MATSAKRRYLAQPVSSAHDSMAENAEQDAFGQEYRKMLIIDLSNGTIDAAKLTKTAWLHTKSGGRGVEDLMLEPTDANAKHASELVERIFRAEYPPPPLLKLAVPATPKRDNNRDNSYVVDVQLPSSILIELVENHIEAIDAMQAELLDLFRTHPVVTEARSEPNPIHESRLRPATIYWDGVGYSKRDQFLGFFYIVLPPENHSSYFLLGKRTLVNAVVVDIVLYTLCFGLSLRISYTNVMSIGTSPDLYSALQRAIGQRSAKWHASVNGHTTTGLASSASMTNARFATCRISRNAPRTRARGSFILPRIIRRM